MQGDGPECGRERGVWMLDVIPCNAMRFDAMQMQMQSVQRVRSAMKWLCLGFGRVVCEKKVVQERCDQGQKGPEMRCSLLDEQRQARERGVGGWLGLDVRHGRRSETSGNQLKMSCKTRVKMRNERLQRLDERQTGRFKRNRRQRRAEMGDVQDDSSPAAMRALAPIPVELCKPTRAVPPAPP